MFNSVLEHRAGPTKTVTGIEQAIDLRSVPRPLLDLVEIVQVAGITFNEKCMYTISHVYMHEKATA